MNPEPTVAVYWDFENIHASVLERTKGAGSYRQLRYSQQERVIDVDEVMRFCESQGRIAINRAYGNWQWFCKYRETLLHHAVELIQLFPAGASAKNGADIKLCLDAVEDMLRFPHIATIVIIGGDSDFLPLSHKVKATGRTLVGVGGEASTNRHWANSCHDFRFYERLLPEREAEPESRVARPLETTAEAEASPPLQAGAAELIQRAVAQLSSTRGDPWVPKAAILPMAKRLDPSFDERTYGVSSFAELLKKHASRFETRTGEHDHEVRIAAPA